METKNQKLDGRWRSVVTLGFALLVAMNGLTARAGDEDESGLDVSRAVDPAILRAVEESRDAEASVEAILASLPSEVVIDEDLRRFFRGIVMGVSTSMVSEVTGNGPKNVRLRQLFRARYEGLRRRGRVGRQIEYFYGDFEVGGADGNMKVRGQLVPVSLGIRNIGLRFGEIRVRRDTVAGINRELVISPVAFGLDLGDAPNNGSRRDVTGYRKTLFLALGLLGMGMSSREMVRDQDGEQSQETLNTALAEWLTFHAGGRGAWGNVGSRNVTFFLDIDFRGGLRSYFGGNAGGFEPLPIPVGGERAKGGQGHFIGGFADGDLRLGVSQMLRSLEAGIIEYFIYGSTAMRVIPELETAQVRPGDDGYATFSSALGTYEVGVGVSVRF